MLRVGAHIEPTWKFRNWYPWFARRLMFGVKISPPYTPVSDQPRSSATMSRMLGLWSAAWGAAGKLAIVGATITTTLNIFQIKFLMLDAPSDELALLAYWSGSSSLLLWLRVWLRNTKRIAAAEHDGSSFHSRRCFVFVLVLEIQKHVLRRCDEISLKSDRMTRVEGHRASRSSGGKSPGVAGHLPLLISD